MTAPAWKERLAPELPADLAQEIDVFEQQIELRKHGKLDEKVFAETRLRRGVYGQRYDNGQRHDGVASRRLAYPDGAPTKGPDTLWDAPGMQRIKIPYGRLTPEQLEVLGALSEEYADGICHITTRQDVQLHFVHIDDTPDLMRRLAAAGITTREACGNTVRNVTACPIAGVCHDETFDVTPYAHALTYYLLGHDDTQGFGRKFKIAFSGCAQHACGLTTIHDLGFIARTRDGRRGFAFYVGGGLGSVPYAAQLFDEFLPEEELLPMSLAVCRVFARLGEKRNRARARMKFVVAKLGIDELRRVVREERAGLRDDPRWTDHLATLERHDEAPKHLIAASTLVRRGNGGASAPSPFDRWRATNVRAQKQAGYNVVTITCPLGDISAAQARGLADLARQFTLGTMRATVEQNLVLRWVSDADVEGVYQALAAIGLAEPGAGTIVDVTACPGTDTCKLGIASSRGLGAVLGERLAARSAASSAGDVDDAAIRDLRVKVSGCFNSCGQHHVADVGFWGVSRKVGSHTVPHFQVVLGGQWSENARSYGLAVGAVPSKNVPAALDGLLAAYTRERESGESFQSWVKRSGKSQIRKLLEPFMAVPAYDADKTLYSDHGDPREFTIGDLGVGECAGEVVSAVQFGLADSERRIHQAQELFDKGSSAAAAALAYQAMLTAARALAREIDRNLGDDPDAIVSSFRAHLHDTELFHDPFAGGKFGAYLLHAHAERDAADTETARKRLEESQLFVEASHACYSRLVQAGKAV
jgi:sulfite reductase (ferredoxin)